MINDDYDPMFEAAGAYYGVDPRIGKTLFHVESNGDDKVTSGSSGEEGPLQFMPRTAAGLNLQNPMDMKQAIPAAFQYFKQGLDANNGDPMAALRYYNGGPNGPNNPATQAYAQKAANLFDSMTIKSTKPRVSSPQQVQVDPRIAAGEDIINGKSPTAPSSTPPTDPRIAAGEDIISGKSSTASVTPSTDPRIAAGESLLANVPASDQTQTANAQPVGLQQASVYGLAHGIAEDADNLGSGLRSGAQYLAKNVPILNGLTPYLDQFQKNHEALAAQRDAENKAQGYTDNPVWQAANVGGQIVGSLPSGSAIGKLGVMTTGKLAQLATSPTGINILKGIGDLATGTTQGAAAAALTGGDPVKGAVAGGAMGSLGILGSEASAALGGTKVAGAMSNLAQSKIGDKLVDLLSRGVGYHFGDLGGALVGDAIAPIIKQIAAKYGPAMGRQAKLAIEAANSDAASTASGVIGGKIQLGPLGQQIGQ